MVVPALEQKNWKEDWSGGEEEKVELSNFFEDTIKFPIRNIQQEIENMSLARSLRSSGTFTVEK